MRKTSQKTNDAISLLQQGYSCSQVAERLSVSVATAIRIRKEHFPGLDKPKGGRPPSLSEQDKRKVVRQITSGKFDTAVEVRKDLAENRRKPLSVDTVRRALKDSGLKARAKVKKPALSRKHR